MLARAPLRDQVYLDLLQRVQRGAIPPGSRVRDSDIAKQLGVSRTPVREALIRLAREGALHADVGRGFRVRPLDPEELKDIGAILAALEPLALDLVPGFPPERLAALGAVSRRLEQTRGDIDACIELDDEWHRLLLADCPNRRLLALIETLRQTPRRYLRHYLQQAGRLSLSTVHHGRVADALGRGDRAAAGALLERRWTKGLEEIVSALR
ncbi:MAG TPA: GntR family transcriptional regulator [Gemmatimonadales bacterium]|nr:GntR family transcriptional regulator [Gemmatimonadales bacterium]